MRFKVKIPPAPEVPDTPEVEELEQSDLSSQENESAAPAIPKEEMPGLDDVEAPPKQVWTMSNKMPDEDSKRRDWTRPNRKLAYMYPKVILPGWREKRNPDNEFNDRPVTRP